MRRSCFCACLPLLLAACADTVPEESPGDDVDAVEPYDRPAYRAASPSAAGEPRTLPNSAMQWYYDEASKTATYGASPQSGVITLRCTRDDLDNPVLVFNWNVGAIPDASNTVTMSWGKDSEMFGVGAVETRLTPSGYAWTATLRPTGEEANFLLAAVRPITFRFGALGEPNITVPADDRIKSAIQACQ